MTGNRNALNPDRGVYGRADVPLLTAAEAAAADRRARESFGIPGRVLMENAGRAAALILQRLWPEGHVVGVAGPGNNGGDLLVMLRTLAGWGRAVSIICPVRAPDAVVLHGADISLLDGTSPEAAAAASEAAVFVDGLLGTGAEGAPRGPIADWVERVAARGRPVLALDLPTGVDATTGQCHDPVIRADVTVTFGWPKLGLLLHPARAHCGRLVAVDIGFPAECGQGRARLITSGLARMSLRPREPTAHKGSAGRLLVVAGQEGMAGAAVLATSAALRSGAGLIRVASAAANRVVLQTAVPEATFLDRARLTAEELEPMHALLAGPGLGTDDDARAALHSSLGLMRGKPMLLDADALNLLAAEPDVLRAVAGASPCVITPHARELARLTDTALDDIVADAPAAARRAAQAFGCIVLLKGQPSLVADAEGELYVNTVGSSDVATAGMGDQLAGTCAALLAAGYEPRRAAALGLFISGRAADLAGLGRSLTPSDVTHRLAEAILDPGPARSTLDLPFVTFDQPSRW
jgi:ADP-dependent NAD(P)H-hydrate dehydratase / NAD(P)H-hydrate epimerase